jgi:signal transduction histidine kinase
MPSSAFDPQAARRAAPDEPVLRREPAVPAASESPLGFAAALQRPLRRERLIAGCRAAFAAIALLALLLDPAVPARFASLGYAALAAYTLYAVLLAAWLRRRRALVPRLPLVLHAVDLGLFALLVLVSDGASSPFVVAFVFLLASAALRWQQRGAAWTAALAIGLYLAIGLLSASRWSGPELGADQVLIRGLQLLLLTLLIAYLGTGEGRWRRRNALLADWPAVMPADAAGQLPLLLGHAARALQAPRLLLVWEERDEPLLNRVLWQNGRCDWRHDEPDALQPPSPRGLAGCGWFVPDTRGRSRLFDQDGLPHRATPALPPWLQHGYAPRSVLSVPLTGDSVSGRLYALDADDLTTDELVLADILAHRIAVRLDQLDLFDRFHREGLAGERMRFARDLHDGVIQSLAAGALRLESAKQMLEEQPLAASQLIEQIQDLLLSEQRELREFLGSIEPRPADAPSRSPRLADRLAALAARIERHWDLQVLLDNRLPRGGLPAGLDHQLHCLVLEALVNASRHGRASRALVGLSLDHSQLLIEVADDGGGFPFTGRRSFEELSASQSGPASIRHRVTTLGGRLDITSGAEGATLRIALPFRPMEPVA